MNATERDELLSAAGETFPKLKYKTILKHLKAMDADLPKGRWLLRLGADTAWDAPDLEFRTADGKSGLLLSLDARKGKITKRASPNRVRTPWKSVRFADPDLDARMRAAANLCPIAASHAFGDEWSLQLTKPEPWPRFLRLDVASPFAAFCTVHSMILLMRGVEEFGFRGPEPRVVVG